MSRSVVGVGTSLCVGVALSFQSVAAQGAPFVWQNATEFSYVSTAGNSSSNTVGLKSTLTGSSDGNTFKLEVGGIRASSSFTDRSATGTVTNPTILEVERTEQSAENYFARGRYDRTIGGGFAFGGGGWQRNTFSGVNHRLSLVAGLGKSWVDGDSGLFKTDVGGTYTIQKDVEDDPTKGDGFGGLRATIEGTRVLTETTDLATTLVADENLRDTEDLRIDWVTSLAVALTEGLTFRTSFQLLFDNAPARVGVPLLDALGGQPTGQSVLVPTREVDTFLTLSLVIKL